MNKISIIGSGSVGSTIAYTLTVCGLASEIVLIDINNEKALGEALDIRQGLPFCNPCSIYAGSYADIAGSNIVIITSGLARKPGQTRLELSQSNVNVLKSIMPEVTKYASEAVFLIVSNPVDILTYAFCKYSGIPQNRVIGSGTILDTARLRSRLSEYFSISQNNVHAYVLGEHGDSSFIPWSLANISNIPIAECHSSFINKEDVMPSLDYAEIEDYVRKSGGRVIERKGATFYAVSISVCHICRCILSGIDTTMTVSTMLNGEYGLEDICLSALSVVGHNGIRSKVILPLNDAEIKALHHSADTLRNIIKSIDLK
ncbi:MAG: L-lactate dehydrogenase [Eubacteriales bacterium]|nr:L-lactate dehydrogenase [Eubacteriales bacterium]